MKNLPIGIQDFRDIVKENFLYIDKTRHIYKLVKPEKGVYFLSRPRRFRKSLMVSLLNYLFEGEEELFRGLYIHDKWDWGRKYPVLRFDMSSISTDNVKKMEIGLRSGLKRYFEKYEIEYENTGKEIIKVGINFSTEAGNISAWKIAPGTRSS